MGVNLLVLLKGGRSYMYSHLKCKYRKPAN